MPFNVFNMSEAAANPFNFCVDVRIGVQRAHSQEGQASSVQIAPSSFCQCQCYNSNILVNSKTSRPPPIRSIPTLLANNQTTLIHYPHKTRNSHHNAEPSLLSPAFSFLSMIAFSSSIVSLRNFYRTVMCLQLNHNNRLRRCRQNRMSLCACFTHFVIVSILVVLNSLYIYWQSF